MAAIPGFRLDITGASGSQGLLSPRNGWRAYVFPRGGNASQDSTGTLITFDSADIASRFAVNNWIEVGTDTANIRRVTAVGGNSMSVNSAVTVSENDRVFLIGNTQPSTSGGSTTYTTPNTLVRQRGDDAADLYTNSMITTNANGLVQAYSAPAMYDVLVQDGNRSNQGYVADMEVGTVEGVSVIDAAFFGSTVNITGNVTGISVSGWATFGSTVTATAGVSFGSTVSLSGVVRGNVSDVFNVRAPQYGAVGDDSTNDYTAINAAITAAAAANGSLGATVYFPPGTYRIGTGLTIPAGVRLLGSAGRASIIKMANNANIDLISRSGSHGQYRWFENLYLDGNRANNASGRGIYWLGGAASTAFRNITIVDMPGRGLVLDNCDLTRVDNIYINNCGDIGFAMLDCTECFVSHLASERSGAGATQSCIFIRGGNSLCGANWVVEQNSGSSYTPAAGSFGLMLDSTIAFSLYGFGALGNGLATTTAIGISNNTTPGRTTRVQIHNATQASYTNLILDNASTPNQTITSGGLNHYDDGFQTFSLTMLSPTSGIGWGIASTVVDRTGTGSPEGVVTASIGSVYRRTDGSTSTTLYVKEIGTTSSGWTAK